MTSNRPNQANKPRPVQAARPPACSRAARLVISGIAAFLILLTVVFAGIPTMIVVGLACLCLVQGLWRGAAELVGLVVATVVALALSPPIGRGLEGAFAGMLGTGGVLNRMISIGIVALLIIVIGSAGLGILARRQMKRHEAWLRWDSYAGGALGLVEGVLLGMAVLWTGLALEPIAAGQLAAAEPTPESEPAPPNPVAERLVKFAGDVRSSALGPVAAATNPIEGARILALSQAFAAISRDEEAFNAFMSTDVMQTIRALPSVQTALERIKADPSLMALYEQQGVTPQMLSEVLQSPTVLDIFDRTTILSDLKPMGEPLAKAIEEAKAIIDRR
jgi:hypothetical protein